MESQFKSTVELSTDPSISLKMEFSEDGDGHWARFTLLQEVDGVEQAIVLNNPFETPEEIRTRINVVINGAKALLSRGV